MPPAAQARRKQSGQGEGWGGAWLQSTSIRCFVACLYEHVNAVGPVIPEIKPDASIGKFPHRRRYRAVGEIPARGQHHRVARASEAAIEDQFAVFQPVTYRRGV